jgi:hypothetical protein
MLPGARLLPRNTVAGTKQSGFLLMQQCYIALHSAEVLPEP